MARHKSTKIHRVCEICGVPFQIPAYFARLEGRGRFCSKPCQRAWQRVPLEARFRARLGGTNERGCLLWAGGTGTSGYGIIGAGGKYSGHLLAHRVAWELANGPIPDGFCVLHRCDNPPCVNPAHLFLGTHADNVADKIAKGRQPVGEDAGPSKLTESQVRSIRGRYAAGGVSQKQLGRENGVAQGVIWCVIHRKTWEHVL